MVRNLANELFLLLVNLTQIRDRDAVVRLFTEALSNLFDGLEFEFKADQESSDAACVEVVTSSMRFGLIAIKGSWETLSSDLKALIRNAVRMLALVLENRYQEKELAGEKERLEATVAQRTADLVEANRSLQREIAERKTAEENLQEKTEELERYFTSSLDLLCIADTDGHFLRLNPEWEKTLGYALSELEGSRFLDFVHKDDLRATIAALSELESQKDVLCFENRFRCKDGTYRWIEWRSRPKGKAVYAAARDITDRKKAEEAVKNAEKFYRAVFENACVGIDVVDVEGRLLQVNSALAQMLGYSQDELLNANIFDLNHPDDLAVSLEQHDKLVLGHTDSYRFEKRYLKKGGELLWADVSVSAVRGPDGVHEVTIAVVADITERKLAEFALEKRIIALTNPLDHPDAVEFDDLFNLEDIQKLQDQFAQATGVASIITHTDGRPITKASNFCRLCRDIIRRTDKGLANCHKSDSVIGRYHHEGPVVQPCLSGGLWDAGAGISVGGRHIANWLIGQVRDETQTEEDMREYAREIGADEDDVVEAFRNVTTMPRDQFQAVARALFTVADQLSNAAYQNIQQARFITQRKKAEKEKELLQKQLLQAQKMESIGTLAGGIAHDFNNLLQVILGYSDLLLFHKKPTDKEYAGLCAIRQAGKDGSELAKRILAFSRRLDPIARPLNLNDELRRVRKILERTIPRMIEIETFLSDDLMTVNADPGQMEQILLNLAVNAQHAMPDGGKLTIETANKILDEDYCRSHLDVEPGKYVLLTVSDTGHGMDKDVIEHIFEPFYTTKRPGEGTGLGLAMVFGIIKSHKGRIICYSEPGTGTTFKIYLPAVDLEIEQDVPTTIQMPAFGTETVLLVDDEESIRKLAEQMLRMGGYHVLTAPDGREALELYRSRMDEIALVLLDLIMPEMGGKQCLEELLKINPEIKVVVASGYSVNGNIKDFVEAGAKGFVGKPYEMKELLTAVRKFLDENE